MAYDKVVDSALLDAGMTATADAIRAKTGQTAPVPWENANGFASAIAGIATGGGGGENPLDYAIGLAYAFYGATFPSGTELNVSFGDKAAMRSGYPNTNVLNNTFYGCTGVKSVKISSKLVFLSPYSMSNVFNACEDVETIDLTGMSQPLMLSAIDRGFRMCAVLKEILGELDVSNCTNFSNCFANDSALETISFKAGTIKKSIGLGQSSNLTDATIQNIIDGLADLTGGTAQTLTLNKTVGAKLTDAQKASASAKNWTISY